MVPTGVDAAGTNDAVATSTLLAAGCKRGCESIFDVLHGALNSDLEQFCSKKHGVESGWVCVAVCDDLEAQFQLSWLCNVYQLRQLTPVASIQIIGIGSGICHGVGGRTLVIGSGRNHHTGTSTGTTCGGR